MDIVGEEAEPPAAPRELTAEERRVQELEAQLAERDRQIAAVQSELQSARAQAPAPGLAAKVVWSRRYDEINAFERYLVDNGTHLVKLFLHISPREQLERIRKRLHDPAKRWKFNPCKRSAKFADGLILPPSTLPAKTSLVLSQ
jgi:hypothetical protein